MSEITLSVKDRILLTPLFPKQGGRIEMTVVLNLFKKIEFTPDEIDLFELKDTPGGVMGNPKKFYDKPITLSDAEAVMLKSIPQKADQQRIITIEMFPLLDKLDAL